jgi:hypothetical protein
MEGWKDGRMEGRKEGYQMKERRRKEGRKEGYQRRKDIKEGRISRKEGRKEGRKERIRLSRKHGKGRKVGRKFRPYVPYAGKVKEEGR